MDRLDIGLVVELITLSLDCEYIGFAPTEYAALNDIATEVSLMSLRGRDLQEKLNVAEIEICRLKDKLYEIFKITPSGASTMDARVRFKSLSDEPHCFGDNMSYAYNEINSAIDDLEFV